MIAPPDDDAPDSSDASDDAPDSSDLPKNRKYTVSNMNLITSLLSGLQKGIEYTVTCTSSPTLPSLKASPLPLSQPVNESTVR